MDPWTPSPPSAAETGPCRVVCFAYAGGGASAFAPWRAVPGLVVRPMEYPGRESRWGEPAAPALGALVDALADELPDLDAAPWAFWGHSMGALVAFELARRLQARGAALPCHLFVSGARAPHLPPRDPIHHLPAGSFLARLAEYGGIPAAVLENRELLSLLLPVVRHDFGLLERHEFGDSPPLAVPVSAFGGLQDEHVPIGDLLAWSRHTSSSFRPRFLAGGHFFPFASIDAMAGYLREDLEGVAGAGHASTPARGAA
ncbi:MAG TPA: thioesterase domain-containing protein [Longimicrobium sp.]|nr:thioesterase domain-containing protein [Longimicrobium sp.]